MNYATIKECDVANGPGVRVSLFLLVDAITIVKDVLMKLLGILIMEMNLMKKQINKILKDLDRDYIEGLSLLGGEPLEYANQKKG